MAGVPQAAVIMLLSLLFVSLMRIGIPQTPADTLPAVAFHSVVYVEVMTTAQARAAAVAAFKSYQTAVRLQDGFVRFDAFEQTGRPGHFVFIETWRDLGAFDKRASAVQTQLTDALRPIRVSDVDRRPYKTLAVGPIGRTIRDSVFVITHVDASPAGQVPMMLQRLAEESRRDDGNLRFDVLQHTMRANHFTIIEAWRDRSALDAHAAAAHTRQYRDEFGPMAGSPLDERVFEHLDL
jgi:quinol monooxygenase YgiN